MKRRAGPGFDGASAVQTHMTNSRLTDPEILETRLPVRLETRFSGVRDLKVRVYPDDIHVDSLEVALTPAEVKAGTAVTFRNDGRNEGDRLRQCLTSVVGRGWPNLEEVTDDRGNDAGHAGCGGKAQAGEDGCGCFHVVSLCSHSMARVTERVLPKLNLSPPDKGTDA